MDNLELVAIQLISVPDVDANFIEVTSQLEQWQSQRTSSHNALVVLPECFAFFGGNDKGQLALLEPSVQTYLKQWCCDTARTFGIWLVTGSIPTPSCEPNKLKATSWLINPAGEMCAEYVKAHLFDVDVADNTRAYRESATTVAGEQAITYTGAIGHIGMAVCYDLRFSALFNAMSAKKPLDVIVLPAAFTYTTGKAHWHSLLAARAIEYQSYVVAANQGGVHANGRETFGHTVIYSPWGERIACIEQGCGWISCHLDHEAQEHIRQAIPMAQHRKVF